MLQCIVAVNPVYDSSDLSAHGSGHGRVAILDNRSGHRFDIGKT